MIKKIIKRLLKKFSFNYNEIHERCDIIEKQNKNIENQIENINMEITSIKEIFNTCNLQLYNYLDAKSNIFNNEFSNGLHLLLNNVKMIEEKVHQLDYCNLEYLKLKKENNKKNILIIGFYGAPNFGDELMLSVLLDYFKDNSKYEITIMLADNKDFKVDKYVKFRCIHYPRTQFDFDQIVKYFDYIVFGGGAIIDDTNFNNEKAFSFDLASIFIKTSLKAFEYGKKVIVLGVSSSSIIQNQNYLSNLEIVIDKSMFFSVRDNYTKKILCEKFPNVKSKITLIVDIAFASKYLLDCELEKSEKNFKVGIIWICNEENSKELKFVLQEVKKYKEKYKIKNFIVELIPFYDYLNNDKNFYKKFLEQYDNESIEIIIKDYPDNIVDLLNILKYENCLISLRYHGILTAYSIGLPCVSICYDKHPHYCNKIKYLNEIFGFNNIVNYMSLVQDEVLKEIEVVVNRKDNEEKRKNFLRNSEIELQTLINKFF